MPGLFTGQALAQGVQAYDQSVAQQDQLKTSAQNREAKQLAMKAQKMQMYGQDIKNQQQQNILDEQEQFQRQQQQIAISKGTSKQAFNNYFEFINEGQVGKGVESFNKVIQQDPMLSEMYGQIAPIDAIHDKNKVAQYLQSIDPSFETTLLTDDLMKQIATTGAFVKDNNGQVVDVQSVAIQTGEWDNLTSQARQTMNDNIAALSGSFKEASLASTRKRDSLEQRRAVEQRIMELKAELDSMSPNDPKYAEVQEQLNIEQDDLVKRTTTAGEAAEGREGRDVAKIREDVDFIRDKAPTSFSSSELSGLRKHQEKLHKDVGPVQVDRAKRLGKEMEGSQRVINSVNAWLNEYKPKLDKGEIDKGFIANPVQWVRSKFGEGELSDEQVAKSVDTIKSNTRVGLIVTDFIKTTTGLAMTEAERKAYNEIITGGAGADEASIVAAITSFRDGRKEVNDTYAEQIMDVSPYDAMKFRQYTKVKETKKEEKKKDTRPSRTIGGETRYWDGAKWVK